jgi:hypothetical protein
MVESREPSITSRADNPTANCAITANNSDTFEDSG